MSCGCPDSLECHCINSLYYYVQSVILGLKWCYTNYFKCYIKKSQTEVSVLKINKSLRGYIHFY